MGENLESMPYIDGISGYKDMKLLDTLKVLIEQCLLDVVTSSFLNLLRKNASNYTTSSFLNLLKEGRHQIRG